MHQIQRMKQMVERLNNAARAYYQENREIMPNIEYDRLYDELVLMEKETGVVLSDSPTVRVGYELLTGLPKETHESPMLSLDKTKDIHALREWLGNKKGLLSWKIDGLTIVLSYSDGKLSKAVTRGNGEVGEVVTNNVRVFKNVPLTIPYKGNLVLRGEAVIRYSDFERMNREIADINLKYKNPRNLCSGSVRQLNNRVTAERNVYYFAFALVSSEGVDFNNSRLQQMIWLRKQGFDIAEYKEVDAANLEETVAWFAGKMEGNDLPADGLVLTFDDIAYGQSLGRTAKFPKDAIAFKWQDEVMETQLVKVEWSASRTGLINPIAVFEPVELEGTTVQRASVHNISVMEGLELGIGDTIRVYKANMIIPQISENKTRSGPVAIPEQCPVCGHKTVIQQENDVKSLFCTNENCLAKQIKSFTHFVGRDAMGIDGLSEATIEKFISNGLIREYADIFRLERYENEITQMEGFGIKSFRNLIDAINKARVTNAVRLLYSLGIPNIGLSNAKLICKEFSYDWEQIQNASRDQLLRISGVGEVMANEYVRFFNNERNLSFLAELMKEIKLERIETTSTGQPFEGIRFVITGAVNEFSNRNELKDTIEQKGGKVTDSVTSKTDYLINNDKMSGSSKNRKAKELGVPIISEKQFLNWMVDGIKPGE
ncbi:MAG: NAD-dependent DNA ligase LigA [Clostridiaceae bacterium]|jgi:DNA ligase (NAD+)|nr:NAD-dependent DNA ligase LigA [Clostridiaceae bacterium]